jgi:hypothetical protein
MRASFQMDGHPPDNAAIALRCDIYRELSLDKSPTANRARLIAYSLIRFS